MIDLSNSRTNSIAFVREVPGRRRQATWAPQKRVMVLPPLPVELGTVRHLRACDGMKPG